MTRRKINALGHSRKILALAYGEFVLLRPAPWKIKTAARGGGRIQICF